MRKQFASNKSRLWYHRQAEVASRGEMFHQPMERRDSTCSPPKPGWTRIARRSFPSSCPICNASTLMTRSCTLIARDASPNSTGGHGSRLMQASGQDSIAATFSDSTYAHIALRHSHHENTHKHKAPVSGLVPTWHSSIRNQLLYVLGLCWVNSQPGHTTKKPTNQLHAHYSLELPLLPIGHLEMQFRCILWNHWSRCLRGINFTQAVEAKLHLHFFSSLAVSTVRLTGPLTTLRLHPCACKTLFIQTTVELRRLRWAKDAASQHPKNWRLYMAGCASRQPLRAMSVTAAESVQKSRYISGHTSL